VTLTQSICWATPALDANNQTRPTRLRFSTRIAYASLQPHFPHYGTVHRPIACQPELRSATSRAAMYMIRSPANEELKRTFKVSVSVLPLPDAEEPVPYTVHWLLETLPALPK
jgi:hypothetical protein